MVTVTSSNNSVAGGSFTLTCDHLLLASTPTYQWFNEAGTMIGNGSTLSLNPLLESHSGEYSCLVTDQSDDLVGCGVHRVTVQGMDCLILMQIIYYVSTYHIHVNVYMFVM